MKKLNSSSRKYLGTDPFAIPFLRVANAAWALTLMLHLLLPASSQAQFNYTDNGNGTCIITAYTGSGGAVTIPSIVNGLTNIGIGNFAFQNKNSLSSVIIPDSVTSIGALAFNGCHNLTSVTIGNSVTLIGSQAFYQCFNLISVTMPPSIANIGNQAFYQCSGLTGIWFLGDAPSIGSSVFSGDNNATVFYLVGTTGWGATFGGLPAAQIQYTYTINNNSIIITGYIGSVSNPTIPDTILGLPVISIADSAFYNYTNLTKITVSKNVTSIGNSAFYGCTNLTGIYFSGNAPNLGSNVFGNDNATIYYFAGTTGWAATLGGLPTAQYQFTYTVNGGTITTLKYIGSNAQAIIPSTMYGLPVTGIGDSTFSYCTNLTAITIPNSITSIGNNAFYNCTRLINVTIPNSVTSIGVNTFISCTSLTSVTIPNSVANIPDSAFPGCTSLNNVTIPNSVTNIGNSAFFNCSSLANVTIGSNVVSLVEEAFCECSSLTNITIPSSVTFIDQAAFSYCPNLKGIYFKGNAPSVGGLLVFEYDTNATAYYLSGTSGWGATYDGLLPPNGHGIPAVLWNPQAQTGNNSFGVKTNQFGFNIIGNSNLVVVVEASTNLANPVWLPVSINMLNNFIGTNGTSYFSDPQWTNYPGRFYRFRSP